MFAAYVENPVDLSFEGQDPDENVLLLLRAHPVTNLTWFIPAVLLFILPFILPATITLAGYNLSALPSTILIAALIIDYLLTLAIVFEGFLSWYFNATLITDKKIVDINFDSLLNKNIDLAPLDKIEEADSKIKGIVGTMFNFGDIAIQTAGSKIAIDVRNVPMPDRVADLVLDMAKKLQGINNGD